MPGSAYIHPVSVPTPLVRREGALDSRVLDGVLALGLTVWTLVVPGAVGDPLRALVLVAMAVAIAWRRRAPVEVLLVEVAGVLLLPSRLELPQGVALLLAAYSAALYSDRRWIVVALLAATGAWVVGYSGQVSIPSGLVPFVLLAPAWLAGIAMRSRGLRAEREAARADQLELAQEAALRAERTRIAHELHDVVTHSVSVMVLQTGAARQILSQDDDRARELLSSVEASGRSALDELRRLLGLLSDEGEDPPLTPPPGLNEIPALVNQVRDAGLPVELSVEGQPRAVPGGAAIAAYRIVQEALTNVLRHAAGAPTRVLLRWADGALELEILDRGALPAVDGVERPPGRGIAGMRERAQMYGGTLEAHAEVGGGYVVRARIPLEPPTA